MEHINIGFYELVASDERNYMLGALLVTDNLGKPVEFRVTYPVKPSLLQRHLYGDSLISHVGIELCGLPLHDALQFKPNLVVVNDKRFLQLGDETDTLVAFLESSGNSLVVENINDQASVVDKIHSKEGRYEAINVQYPSSYGDTNRKKVREIISELYGEIDLLEPFQRITVAVNTLQKADERFR